MSKRRKIEFVDSSQWPDAFIATINWELCVLCQCYSPEALITPKLEGYASLSKNLTEFAECGALPSSVRLNQMDDGAGLVQTFVKNKARYHKICRNKYDAQKLSRISASDAEYELNIATSSTRSTQSSVDAVDIKNSCWFCDKGPLGCKKLVSASTNEIGPRIHAQAVELRDTKLLCKLSTTDLISLEAKYHKDCYRDFRNVHRSLERAIKSDDNDPYRLTYGSVITELVQYMEEMFLYSSTSPVFKLCDLTRLVENRMASLGVTSGDKVMNRTRLKEDLISLIPGLREDKSGREIVLSFEPDVGNAVREACEYNDLTDGMCIARAASILQRD